jgi:hypothetical protein
MLILSLRNSTNVSLVLVSMQLTFDLVVSPKTFHLAC